MATEAETPALAAAKADPGPLYADPPERLPRTITLGFGVGTVGVSCLLNPISSLFPAMMVTVFGMSPAIAGALLTGAKAYDVGADVVIGAVSDRTKSRWGRRRPYMFVGAIIAALAFALIFNPPVHSGTGLVIFMGAMLVIYSTGYSLFNIPYIAMPAEMTDDPRVRTNIISYRTFFISVGQMISVPGAAYLLVHFGKDARGYGIMGWVLAAIILAACMASVFATAKARRTERVETAEKTPFLKHAAMTFGNRPFVLLMSAKLLILFALACTASTQILFFLNVLGIGLAGVVAMGVANNIAMGLAVPLWIKLIHKFGKKPVYIIALLSNTCLILTWLIPGVNTLYAVLLIRGAMNGFLSAAINLAGTSMLPDTMEYDRLRTGLRREGVFASVYAIVEKVAFAIAPLIIGALLAAAHYIPTTGGRVVEQPDSARMALYTTLVFIPVACDVLAAVLLWFYRLDERQMKEIPRR